MLSSFCFLIRLIDNDPRIAKDQPVIQVFLIPEKAKYEVESVKSSGYGSRAIPVYFLPFQALPDNGIPLAKSIQEASKGR
jgi:hypothetical protein